MINRLFGGSALLIAAQVATAPDTAAAAPDPGSFISRTCTGHVGEASTLLRRRLATFILSDQGEIADNPEARVIAIYREEAAVPRAVRDGVLDSVRLLQERLAVEAATPPEPSPGQIRLTAAPTRQDYDIWLFDQRVTLACRTEPQRTATGEGTNNRSERGGNILNRFRLRQSAEALPATGDDRLKAGAAQLGFLRERVVLPDGSTRTDSTLSVQAALGFVLRDQEGSSLLLYADYERQRRRSSPPPVLGPGAAQSDKDVDVLELGLVGNQLLSIPGLPVMLTGSASYLANQIDDSERLRATLSASINAFWRGGPCHFGAYASDIAPGGRRLRARCSLELLGQVNHVLEPGTATIGASDEFVLAGFRGGVDFATGESSGVIAGFRYEYQARLHGAVPSIERLTAQIKYRHWFTDNRFGIEFGFDYTDGTNPKSFADEHRTRFGVGIIF